MSRIANSPISLPSGVDFNISGDQITVKGPKGSMQMKLHPDVELSQDDSTLNIKARRTSANAIAGTMRAILNNLVVGVEQGFKKQLQLIGVGYRAQAQGNKLNLSLGFSHPISFAVPEGVTIETPTQTEIIVSGSDKQKVGQVAAEIRACRPPEPYKGKGIRYLNEHVVRKEAKKA